MRTLRLSMLILVLIVIPLSLLVALGCGPQTVEVKDNRVVTTTTLPGDEAESETIDLGALFSRSLELIDPDGDVYHYGTGDDVADHPELDLTECMLGLDEVNMQIEMDITCAEEPGKDEFWSGFIALTDEKPSDRPLGDPFAAHLRYLYFWRMNTDSYASVLEQTGGVATEMDASLEWESDGSTFRLKIPVKSFAALLGTDVEWDSTAGSAYMVVVATDGFGNCDYLDEIRPVAEPWKWATTLSEMERDVGL